VTVRKLPKQPTGNKLLTREEVKQYERAFYGPLPDEPPVKEPKKAPRRKETLAYALVKPQTPEGFVTLPQLAAERGMQPQLARIWIKNANLKKPGTRWQWPKGSPSLKRARKVLGLPA